MFTAKCRGGCLVAVVSLIGFGCRKPSSAESNPPVEVKVARVHRGTLFEGVETSGALSPPPGWDVKLGSLVSGRLAEVKVAEGDRVQQGQLLMRIEATALKDQVAAAEASLSQTEAKEKTDRSRYQRTQQLFDEGIIARQEVDDSHALEAASIAAARSAHALLSTAKNQLARSEIKSPFKGAVVRVLAAAGEPVEGNGKPLIEVARTEALELRANLSSVDLTKVHPGQAAFLTVDGISTPIPGKVIAVSPTLDAITGTGIARIQVDNTDGRLKGGAFAKVRIVVGQRSDVLEVGVESLIPIEASPNESAVMVVDSDGKARKHKVKVGIIDSSKAEIVSGLQDADTVIVGGAYALPEGTPVHSQ